MMMSSSGSVLGEIAMWIQVIFQAGIPMIIGVFALIGAVMVITTRADAFDAADRKSRGVWAAMMFGSAAFLIVPGFGWLFMGIPIIAGIVITGIYWMDVRPQIKDLLANAQG